MWIDTAGTLLQKSANLCCPEPDYHASSHRFMLHNPRLTNAGPDLLRHSRLDRGAKYIHSPHSDRVRDPVVEVGISELLVLVQTECDGQ
ncbi:hypothetical protein BASA62_005368 [Batrachochytrium salamandrivorans]|nr:hypothetical protein BASA62_005368 [Batrachochytrium salamandrivorans]